MARKRTFRGSVVVDDFDVLVKELKKLDPQLKKILVRRSMLQPRLYVTLLEVLSQPM